MSRRVRKQVQRFDPISAHTYALLKKKEEEKNAGLPEPGEGDTTLGSIEEIKQQIGKHGSNDEVLILLHRAVYGRDGKATTRKAGIRRWFGTKDEKQADRLRRSLGSSKWTMALLGQLCAVLCLEKSGTKEVVLERVEGFLLHPVTDHEDKKLPVTKTPKKKKPARKKAKAKKAKKKAGPKRTLSSYMIWLKEEGRAAAKESNPEATTTEIAKICGKLWGEMSDEDKQAYKDQAAQLKEDAAAAAPATKPRPAKRKRSASSAGGSGTPAPKQTAKSRLRDAKQMLEEGLIEQDEYDDLKGKILASLAK